LKTKAFLYAACLSLLVMTLSGCALLALPGQIIGGVFSLLGQAFKVAEGLPKPPPGVFF
jgi:hypothetical protein